ncbi:hypothetical protein D3C81_959090 [compost metagenome]
MMDFSGKEAVITTAVVLAGLQFASAVICQGVELGMASASGLPAGVAANRAFRQQAARDCVDFVRV